MDKKIGVNQPKRIENAKILIANTGMDTDKIKVSGFHNTFNVIETIDILVNITIVLISCRYLAPV